MSNLSEEMQRGIEKKRKAREKRRRREKRKGAIRLVLEHDIEIDRLHAMRDAQAATKRKCKAARAKHGEAIELDRERLSTNPGVPILVKPSGLDKK